MLTMSDAIRAFEEIKRYAIEGDYEAAHSEEDDLLQILVQSVQDAELIHPSEHCPLEFLKEIAELCVQARGIKFARHCA